MTSTRRVAWGLTLLCLSAVTLTAQSGLVDAKQTFVSWLPNIPAVRFVNLFVGPVDTVVEILTPNVPCGTTAGLVGFGKGTNTNQGAHSSWIEGCDAVDAHGWMTWGAMNRDYLVNVRDDGLVGLGSELVSGGNFSPTARLHVLETLSAVPHIRVEDPGANSNPAISIKNDVQDYLVQTTGDAGDAFQVWDQTAGSLMLEVSKAKVPKFEGLKAPTGTTRYVCANDQGVLYLSSTGC